MNEILQINHNVHCNTWLMTKYVYERHILDICRHINCQIFRDSERICHIKYDVIYCIPVLYNNFLEIYLLTNKCLRSINRLLEWTERGCLLCWDWQAQKPCLLSIRLTGIGTMKLTRLLIWTDRWRGSRKRHVPRKKVAKEDNLKKFLNSSCDCLLAFTQHLVLTWLYCTNKWLLCKRKLNYIYTRLCSIVTLREFLVFNALIRRAID